MMNLQVHHCSIFKDITLFRALPICIFIYLCYKQSIYTEAAGLVEQTLVIIFIRCHLSCGKTFIAPLCQCTTL